MNRQTDTDQGQAVSNRSLRPPSFTDQMMWIAIRGHILAIASALHDIPERTPLIIAVRAALLGIAKAIALRWGIKDRTN